MISKRALWLGVLVNFAIIAAIVLAVRSHRSTETKTAAASRISTANENSRRRERPPEVATPEVEAPVQQTDSTAPSTPELAAKPKAQKATPPSGKAPKQKEPIQDPVARLALAFVGEDAEAEDYWVSAINNPDLPANERKDLIEDLNEDGLSDPKHPGPQDLPLIIRRIQWILLLQPYAMDGVNADALAEALKDLYKMLDNM